MLLFAYNFIFSFARDVFYVFADVTAITMMFQRGSEGADFDHAQISIVNVVDIDTRADFLFRISSKEVCEHVTLVHVRFHSFFSIACRAATLQHASCPTACASRVPGLCHRGGCRMKLYRRYAYFQFLCYGTKFLLTAASSCLLCYKLGGVQPMHFCTSQIRTRPYNIRSKPAISCID